MQTDSIEVDFVYTTDSKKAAKWLSALPDMFAADFEVAVKYTPQQLAHFKTLLNSTAITKRTRITLESKIKATALDHPSHTCLTHFSCAWSASDAFVLVLDNEEICNTLLKFLVTTDKKQIWHNASFDFKHIYHYTNKLPKNYEDSQIRAKCILNHVETWKANTGLKELAGKWYGDWGISSDNFDVSQMYEDKVIRYAATDACATYKLWESITEYVESEGN